MRLVRLAGSFVVIMLVGYGCAAGTEDEMLPVSETAGAEDSVRVPSPSGGRGDAAPAPPDGAVAADADAGTDATKAPTWPQTVMIKLTSTQPTWIVESQSVFMKVLKDAKNCNIFGNNCDQDVDLKIFIDGPSGAVAPSPSCSLVQAGLGPRKCSEGHSITKSAMLSPGDDVTVRFIARAVDPGSDPNCSITKTWTFTGTAFDLKGETFPASGLWQCAGGGSGQDLEVQIGYQLAL